MAKLTTTKRNDLPKKDFAIPGKRAYPVNDASHARNALARVSQNGSPAQKAEVKAKVEAKFPGIAVGGAKGGTKAAPTHDKGNVKIAAMRGGVAHIAKEVDRRLDAKNRGR